ncbi:S53 family peptidase [Lentilactobacillus senioris]|uniref:S53 family peptidase n=1 Tax=Lentilactobacillus senioris TaxID=931534 RepID=UPI002280FFE0|nr:S53 family peptidase [Lentilactobacillus senioris]MCY9807087.1 S53 family peptidase [Lentilactobacillus senioris]
MKKQTGFKLVATAFLTLITLTGAEMTASAKTTYKAVSASKSQLVDIVLKPKSQSAMGSYAYQVVTPSSKNYHKYLTSQQVANKYGQSTTKVNAIKKYLKKYHLSAGVYRGNLVMTVKGSTKNIERAFKVKLYNVKSHGNSYQKAKGTPKLPAKLQKSTMAIFGLSNYGSMSDSVRAKTKGQYQPQVIHKRATSITSSDSPQKFIAQYNLDGLYNNGNAGNNRTMGIITFANFHPSDATKYWRSENIPAKKNRISIYRTNGYKGSWYGYDESTMDVEQAGAIAPKANIRAYVGRSDVTGMVNSVAAAVGENKVDTLSISWGQSEQQVASEIKLGTTPKQYNQIMNMLYAQAAVQGISVFTASGDSGAYDGIQEGQFPALNVDMPASSPYVTAVGGTTLPNYYQVDGKTVKITKERAWSSDFLYPNYKKQEFFSKSAKLASYFTGTGGGFSRYNQTPKYQRGVSGVGTFAATQLWQIKSGNIYLLKAAKNVSGNKEGRNVPDLSVNADPNTGYSTYISSASKAGKNGQWYIAGGTSIAAPQVAAASAVMSSNTKTRLGFWNPQIYRFAEASGSPFTVLDSRTNNSNLYYTGQPGKKYNQATGLGTVDFTKLLQKFKSQK